MSAELVHVSPAPLDAEIAAELRRRLTEALAPVGLILEDARKAGLYVGFSFQFDAFGRQILAPIQINKPL